MDEAFEFASLFAAPGSIQARVIADTFRSFRRCLNCQRDISELIRDGYKRH